MADGWSSEERVKEPLRERVPSVSVVYVGTRSPPSLEVCVISTFARLTKPEEAANITLLTDAPERARVVGSPSISMSLTLVEDSNGNSKVTFKIEVRCEKLKFSV